MVYRVIVLGFLLLAACTSNPATIRSRPLVTLEVGTPDGLSAAVRVLIKNRSEKSVFITTYGNQPMLVTERKRPTGWEDCDFRLECPCFIGMSTVEVKPGDSLNSILTPPWTTKEEEDGKEIVCRLSVRCGNGPDDILGDHIIESEIFQWRFEEKKNWANPDA